MPNELFFDNTRVSTFFTCPRKYYFRHVRGWRREITKPALAFGGAWHVAMEVVWELANRDISDEELLELARNAFEEKWIKEGFSLDPLKQLDEKRNPGLGAAMISAYIKERRAWLRSIEVIAIEQPFIVTLIKENALGKHPPVSYIGRWDKVYREGNRVWVGEHKTTSSYRVATTFDRNWMESFSPNNQVDGYGFAAYNVFGDDFAGVSVDGALVHKKHRGFIQLPVKRTLANLDAWIFETTYWVNEILENMTMLDNFRASLEEGNEHAYMPCFPKRTNSCSDWQGCSYRDICKFGSPNVETIKEAPEGFVTDMWDPFAHNIEDGQEPMRVG